MIFFPTGYSVFVDLIARCRNPAPFRRIGCSLACRKALHRLDLDSAAELKIRANYARIFASENDSILNT
jgi:hypothetical protein